MLESIAPEFIGGFMAIVCAVIGAKVATRSEKDLKRGETLRDAYAEVLAGYYDFLLNASDENLFKIAIATERAVMLCSPQSEELMRAILGLLSDEQRDSHEIGLKIQELRKHAQNDVEHYMGKKRSTKIK